MEQEREHRTARSLTRTLVVSVASVVALGVSLFAAYLFTKARLSSRLVYQRTFLTAVADQLSLYLAEQRVADNGVFTPKGFAEWYKRTSIEGSWRTYTTLKMPKEGVIAVPPAPKAEGTSANGGIDELLVFVPNRYSHFTRRMWFESHWTIAWIVGNKLHWPVQVVYVAQWYTAKPGERPVDEFFQIADSLWRSAAAKNEAEFKRACARFKATDVFAGSGVPNSPTDVVRFSGAQLDALAAVIRGQVFSGKHRVEQSSP